MSRHNPLQVTVSSLGIYMGLGGIEHGIGEMLQGRQPPPGLIFPSWPEVNFFRIVAGEPAMSVIPDLFLSGLFAILSSLCFIIWSARCTRVKNGGVFLVLLATAMLLSGGGIFPPIIGIFLGILASTSSLICNKKAQPSDRAAGIIWGLWLASFSICLASFFLLLPGLSILDMLFGINDPFIPAILLPAALSTLVLASILSLLHRHFPLC